MVYYRVLIVVDRPFSILTMKNQDWLTKRESGGVAGAYARPSDPDPDQDEETPPLRPGAPT